MDPSNERPLVAASRDDVAAFGRLYDFYSPKILGYIYRRVRDYDVAEDLTSITFQRALESVRKSDFRNDSFGGWLYRVASNAVIDHMRRTRNSISLADLGEDGEGVDPSIDLFAGALDRDEIRRALVSLPDMHRELLVLRYYDDLDSGEICSILGCTKDALGGKLQRALRALRAAVARESADVA